MLQGSILPRDARAVTGLTEDITAEIAQALFNAGARALAINDRCKKQEEENDKLARELARKEEDLKLARETCDLYLADFQRCDRERVEAEARAAKAEEDANTLRVTRAAEVDFARKRGYDEGWDAARVEYKKQVREIEAELHRDRFLDGLRYGHEALVTKLNLPEGSDLRTLPEAPPEELFLPEEEEVVEPTSEGQGLGNQTDPNAPASEDQLDHLAHS
ncbi:uncharacterized protein LOC131327310 [Rhododendron vialii]|uniref:uncharacterized protein LOC131327310 n=1 Tax=Rhododendron vialii TaxID=182163 RepID=UPI00265EE4B8|nr:uncharacterized protein LOC131327310 [Rhododendron vialii]